MSYYKVFLSGANAKGGRMLEPVEIFDPSEKTLALINPVVSLEVGSAGSFEFTMPTCHIFSDSIVPYGSTITVYEEDERIFYGRPLPPKIDFYGNKTYHCEGALAFLNDIVLPPIDYGSTSDMDWYMLFDLMMTMYNSFQPNPDRRFMYYDIDFVRNVTIYNYQVWNYETAFEYLRDYLRQFCGGYFYVTYEESEDLVLTWRKSLTDGNNQPVSIGDNLLDFQGTGRTLYTAAIIKSFEDEAAEGRQMIAPVVWAEQAQKYGLICAALECPTLASYDEAHIRAYCLDFLKNQQFSGYMFDVSAADQHPLNPTYKMYKLGEQVPVIIEQLGVNFRLPITSLSIRLDSAIKTVTIGSLDDPSVITSSDPTRPEQAVSVSNSNTKNSVTKSISKAVEKTKNEAVAIAKRESKKSKQTTIKSQDGNDYAIDIGNGTDPVTGAPIVVATKVPAKIMFTREKLEQLIGSRLKYSDFTVSAYFGDETDEDITDECNFNIEDNHLWESSEEGQKTFVATYSKVGKVYYCTDVLTVKSNKARKIHIHQHFGQQGKTRPYTSRYYIGWVDVDYTITFTEKVPVFEIYDSTEETNPNYASGTNLIVVSKVILTRRADGGIDENYDDYYDTWFAAVEGTISWAVTVGTTPETGTFYSGEKTYKQSTTTNYMSALRSALVKDNANHTIAPNLMYDVFNNLGEYNRANYNPSSIPGSTSEWIDAVPIGCANGVTEDRGVSDEAERYRCICTASYEILE